MSNPHRWVSEAFLNLHVETDAVRKNKNPKPSKQKLEQQESVKKKKKKAQDLEQNSKNKYPHLHFKHSSNELLVYCFQEYPAKKKRDDVLFHCN